MMSQINHMISHHNSLWCLCLLHGFGIAYNQLFPEGQMVSQFSSNTDRLEKNLISFALAHLAGNI